MEAVEVGSRNIALFDALRVWAYSARRGASLVEWKRYVYSRALQLAARFPTSLPGREVRDTAYSVSTWVWSRPPLPPIDTSPQAQRRRGLKSGRIRRYRNRERDALILELAQEVRSQRAVARIVGVSQQTVSYVVRRDGRE